MDALHTGLASGSAKLLRHDRFLQAFFPPCCLPPIEQCVLNARVMVGVSLEPECGAADKGAYERGFNEVHI